MKKHNKNDVEGVVVLQNQRKSRKGRLYLKIV